MQIRRPRSAHTRSIKAEKMKAVKESAQERAERYRSMIDGQVIRTRADLARQLGVSRARVTQVLGVRCVRS